MERVGGAVVGSVTGLAVTTAGDGVLVGIGSTLSHFGVDGRLRQTARVFHAGEIIHGIKERNGQVLVFADKAVRLLSLNAERWGTAADFLPRHNAAHYITRSDKIISASFLEQTKDASGDSEDAIALGYFHNFVEVWSVSTESDGAAAQSRGGLPAGDSGLTLRNTSRCPTKCLVYSMDIAGGTDGSCRVASGTIFSDILLWCTDGKTQTGQIIHTLRGHDGVIFMARWSPDGSKIASVSDDRTVRLWTQRDGAGSQLPAVAESGDKHHLISKQPFECQFSSFGHRARVWDVQFAGAHLVSIAEDATAKVWDDNGVCVNTLTGHAPKNVWSVAVSALAPSQREEGSAPNIAQPACDRFVVATGGGDGTVKLWTVPTPRHLRRCIVDVVTPSALPGRTGGNVSPPQKRKARAQASESIRDICTATNSRGMPVTEAAHVAFVISSPNTLSVLHTATEQVRVVYRGAPGEQFTKVCNTDKAVIVGTARGAIIVFALEHVLNGKDDQIEPVLRENLHTSRIRHIGHSVVQKGSLRFGYFVTSDATSSVAVWELADNSIRTVHKGNIPTKRSDVGIIASSVAPCTTRGDTALHVVLGDCYGHVHVLAIAAAPGSAAVYHRLASAHGRHPVALVRFNLDESPFQLVTAGHDGWVHFYDLDNNSEGAPVVPIRRHSLRSDSVAQVEHVFWLQSGHIVIAGFKSSEFVAVDVDSDRKIAEALCGGWKRPRSVHFAREGDPYSLVFLCAGASRQMHAANKPRAPRTSVHTFRNSARPSAQALSLGCPYHGQLTNCAQWAPSLSSGADGVCITGGEDGTIRLSAYRYREDQLHPLAADIRMLLSHKGAVKSLVFSNKQQLLFSASSRGQFCLAHIYRERAGSKRIRPTFLDEFWLPKADANSSAELNQRCLCMALSEHHGDCAVFAGDSAGCLLCFDVSQKKIALAASIEGFQAAPILSMACCSIGGQSVLVCGSSDGVLSVHDVTDAKAPEHLWSSRVHSMGLNGVACHTVSPTRLLVASGGDDQLVTILLFDIVGGEVSVKTKWSSSRLTAASLASIAIEYPFVVCSGAENRLFVADVDRIAKSGRFQTVCEVPTQVHDIQQVATQRCPATNELLVGVAGQGFEAVKFESGSESAAHGETCAVESGVA